MFVATSQIPVCQGVIHAVCFTMAVKSHERPYELSYRIRVVKGRETADEAVRAMRDFQYIESMPLIDDIAEYAAELRFTYYGPGERELSCADAIHVATAVVHDDCGVLYSGDPDRDTSAYPRLPVSDECSDALSDPRSEQAGGGRADTPATTHGL